MLANVLASIREEIEAMTLGHFVPYHILSVLVSIVVTLFFSAVFVHNSIYDGKIAVIDLDQSRTSTALIEKLDTSRYIEVAAVTHHAVNPTDILKGDLLYIGSDFEKKARSRRSVGDDRLLCRQCQYEPKQCRGLQPSKHCGAGALRNCRALAAFCFGCYTKPL